MYQNTNLKAENEDVNIYTFETFLSDRKDLINAILSDGIIKHGTEFCNINRYMRYFLLKIYYFGKKNDPYTY